MSGELHSNKFTSNINQRRHQMKVNRLMSSLKLETNEENRLFITELNPPISGVLV